MNIRLDIEYDGSDFQGWQRQLPGKPTIQSCIEDSLSKILKRPIVVYGASRTDSGVHARGQVANFYTNEADPKMPAERFRVALNSILPPTIRITAATEMPAAFHAQKKALSKIYEYRILQRGYSSALDRRVLFYPFNLDWAEIRRAMPYFVGRHDFKSFQASGSTVLTTEREILRFELFQESEHLYRFEIEGVGFLKQMVRTILGTLMEIGEKRRKPEDIPGIIAARNRRQAGRTLAASGLCLVCIKYPEADSLKSHERVPKFGGLLSHSHSDFHRGGDALVIEPGPGLN